MYHPNELIQDIQERLNRMVQDYRTAIEKNKKLETENKSLALSLEEAIKHQETLSKRLETRKEIRGIMKEVEKCIPQVESLLENK